MMPNITYPFRQADPYHLQIFTNAPTLLCLFQQEKAAKESLFGKMKPITSSEHQKILNETGIDIDGKSSDYL